MHLEARSDKEILEFDQHDSFQSLDLTVHILKLIMQVTKHIHVKKHIHCRVSHVHKRRRASARALSFLRVPIFWQRVVNCQPVSDCGLAPLILLKLRNFERFHKTNVNF